MVNGKDSYITLPLKKDSDYLSVRDRWLSSTWESDRTKMLNRIWNSYNKSPCFNNVFSVIEKIILFDDCNLFDFILNSIIVVLNYLEINTPLVVSSTIPFDSELMSEKKVIDICKTMEANCYVNPIGGVELYSNDNFKNAGIELHFLRTSEIRYKQFKNEFIPNLSIVDVLMFNTIDEIRNYLKLHYKII